MVWASKMCILVLDTSGNTQVLVSKVVDTINIPYVRRDHCSVKLFIKALKIMSITIIEVS